MKKLIFAGLVVLLGTACTSRGGFDGSAHSAGGSTIGMVAKVVDEDAGPEAPKNPIEVTPSTPDYVEVRNPIEVSPENPIEPEWDGDHGWDNERPSDNPPSDDGGSWQSKPTDNIPGLPGETPSIDDRMAKENEGNNPTDDGGKIGEVDSHLIMSHQDQVSTIEWKDFPTTGSQIEETEITQGTGMVMPLEDL